MIISSPYTRTWFRIFLIEDQLIGPFMLTLSARHKKTIDWTGNVVAEPCEANFLSFKKLGESEISSLIHLVRAACRADNNEGFLRNIRSTVQHVRRSLADDRSTVARDRSKEDFTTKSDDRSCLRKLMKQPSKVASTLSRRYLHTIC
jgi:hypothetical protein